jgi:integrase
MPKRVAKDLTEARIRNAKPSDKQYEIFDRAVGGFAVRVSPSGSKAYVVTYRCNGKKRRMTLGDVAGLDLSEARELALATKAQAKAGVDPLDKRHGIKDSTSDLFADVADLYIQRHARGTGDKPNKKTWRQDEAMLQNHVVPVWGNRPISEVGRKDVVALLDTIQDNSGVYTANRVLAVVRKLFNWALLERALIEVTPILPGMARMGEKVRTRVLNDDEIRLLWEATGAVGYPFGNLFRLLLLTGQRLGEVKSMRWSELDMDKALWTIPSDNTKSDRGDHVVPLNRLAVEIINEMHHIDGSDLLFPTSSNPNRAVSGFSKAKTRCDDLVGLKDWRLHDLRRTSATGMQGVGVPPHIIGAVLNHSPQSIMGVTAVYATGNMVEERREALDAWGDKLQSVIAPDLEDG